MMIGLVRWVFCAPYYVTKFDFGVLDGTLRRASRFAFAPYPRNVVLIPDLCAVSVIVNFILRFAEGN
jgi:hypothetical protein